MPPGDDDYTWASGEDRSSSNSRRHAQRPTGAPRYPPPPTWSLAPTHQHVAPPKVKLPPFWAKDPLSWFTLVESTFNRHDVVDSRLHFDLVLPALLEEVIEQISWVLHAVEHLDRPYVDLKARLLRLFTPKPADNCLKLIHGAELGDRRPIQLMEAMLEHHITLRMIVVKSARVFACKNALTVFRNIVSHLRTLTTHSFMFLSCRFRFENL